MDINIQKLFSEKIIAVERCGRGGDPGINTTVAGKRGGVYFLKLRFEDSRAMDAAVKIKSNRLIRNGITIVGEANARLKKELILHKKILGYDDSICREIAVCERAREPMRSRMITYYGVCRKTAQKRRCMVFERYERDSCAMDLSRAKKALDAVLTFHTGYYGDEDSVREMLLNRYDAADYRRAKECLRMLFSKNGEENLRVFGAEKTALLLTFIDRIGAEAQRYSFHRSFTHNDFSTRNLFFTGDGVRLYDFELACYQNPEHDLIEFLMYEAHAFTDEEIRELIRYYRQELYAAVEPSRPVDDETFRGILLFNAYEWTVNRLSLLRIVGRKIGWDAVDVLLSNADRVTDILGGII